MVAAVDVVASAAVTAVGVSIKSTLLSLDSVTRTIDVNRCNIDAVLRTVTNRNVITRNRYITVIIIVVVVVVESYNSL